MSSNHVHVPEPVLRALRETVELGGGLEMADVVGAAVWAFSLQEEAFRDRVISEYLLRVRGAAAPPETRKTIREQLHDLVRRVRAAFRKPPAR
jgi:hypothetical protein